MDVVTKATASVAPVEDSKSKHGEFDVILSTNALDRDGDELHADEWKTPLPDKITFDSDHGMSVATCVGSGRPFINDRGQLQVRGTFASTPHGQAVRTLVNEGHVDSVSVAFLNSKTQKSGKPQRELLNGAFVAVGANPEARVLASKAAKVVDEVEAKDAANYVTDQSAAISDMFENDPLDGGPQRKAYWQGVHDVAVKLGAGCPYSDPQATPDVLNGLGNRSASLDKLQLKAAKSRIDADLADEPSFDVCVAGGYDALMKALEGTDGVLAYSVSSHHPLASPPDSADESAAAAQAAAADESAEDVALLGKSLAIQLGLIEP